MWVRAGSSLRWACRPATSSSSSALPQASTRGLFATSSANLASVQSQTNPPASVPLEKTPAEPKQQYPVQGHEGAPKGVDLEDSAAAAAVAAQQLNDTPPEEAPLLEEEDLDPRAAADEAGVGEHPDEDVQIEEEEHHVREGRPSAKALLSSYSGWPLLTKNDEIEYENNLVSFTSGPAFPFVPKSMGAEERNQVAEAGPKEEMEWALFSNAIGAFAGRPNTEEAQMELETMVTAMAAEALPKDCSAAVLAAVIRGLSAHVSGERLSAEAQTSLEEKLQAAVEQQLKKSQLSLRHCTPLAALLGKQDSTGKAFVPEQRTLELLIEASAKSSSRMENYINLLESFEGLVRVRTRSREATATAPDSLVGSAAASLAKLLGPGPGLTVRMMNAFDKNERAEMLRFLAALHHLPEVGGVAGINASLGTLAPVRWPKQTLPPGVSEPTIAAAAAAITRAGAWSGARVDRLLYQAILRATKPVEAEEELVEPEEVAAPDESEGEAKKAAETDGEAEAEAEAVEAKAEETEAPPAKDIVQDPRKDAWPLWLMAIAQSGKPVSEAPNNAESLREKEKNPEDIVLTKPLQALLQDEQRTTLSVARTIWGLTVLGGKDEERDQLLATLASGKGAAFCPEAWSLLLEVKEAIDSEDAPVEAFQSDYWKSGLAGIVELQKAERQHRKEELEATLKAFGPEATSFEILPSFNDNLLGAFQITTKTSSEEDAEEVKVMFDFEGLPAQYTNLALRRKAWAKVDEGLRVEPLPLSSWDAARDTTDRVLLLKRLIAGPAEEEEDDD